MLTFAFMPIIPTLFAYFFGGVNTARPKSKKSILSSVRVTTTPELETTLTV